MNERVFFHIRFLVEAFAAVLTGIRSGVGVDEEVRGQCGRPLEGFVAYFAAEDPFLPGKKNMSISKIVYSA